MKINALFEDRKTGRRFIQTCEAANIKHWQKIARALKKVTTARLIRWQIVSMR